MNRQHIMENYNQLVARVDALCKNIETSLGKQITCREGCCSCCTAITIFPVEAAALQEMLGALPSSEAEEIRDRVAQHSNVGQCPLLADQRCLLYGARPIICRTHGLPIVYSEGGQRKSDCCPTNLTGTTSISGKSVIDLDTLNTLLVAVNSLYLSQAGLTGHTLERLSISEALTSSCNSQQNK